MKDPSNDLPGYVNQTNQLLRFANDIILLMDQSGKLLDANEAAVNIYGWPLEELLKLNISDLRDPSTLKDLPAHLDMTAQTGALFETRHKHRDGTTFPVEVSTRNFEHAGRKLRQSIIRDISRRHKMLAKMEYDALRIEGLLRLNEIATQLPEKELMQFGLEWVEKLTGSKIAFIHFVNEDQQSIELVAWSAATREKYCTSVSDNHYPLSGAGVWADCLRQLKPVVFNDYANCPDKRGLPEGHSVLQRLISVPVVEGQLVRVVLGVGNKGCNLIRQ
jgi:PAS domain S-box-containing protein